MTIEHNTFLKTVHIYVSIKDFMETNPPCEECLTQGICVQDYDYCISIKKCNELSKFIENSGSYRPAIIMNTK